MTSRKQPETVAQYLEWLQSGKDMPFGAKASFEEAVHRLGYLGTNEAREALAQWAEGEATRFDEPDDPAVQWNRCLRDLYLAYAKAVRARDM